MNARAFVVACGRSCVCIVVCLCCALAGSWCELAGCSAHVFNQNYFSATRRVISTAEPTSTRSDASYPSAPSAPSV